MRHHLSPAFTGSKLKGMIGLIETTCNKYSEFLSKRPDFNEPINIYESFRRMAADLIATTAFGSASDSINNPESEFYKNGTKIMAFTGSRSLVLMGYLMSPKYELRFEF
jgi:cytochrome P450